MIHIFILMMFLVPRSQKVPSLLTKYTTFFIGAWDVLRLGTFHSGHVLDLGFFMVGMF
jgi:hypothetical protein